MALLLSLLFSLFGCADKSYQEYEVGENFGHNIDGHFKKLPENYCIEVLLGSRASVFIVGNDKLAVPFFEKSVYLEEAVVEGHYIKGWFNDSHLVLCEEGADDQCKYFSLKFGSNEIVSYESEKQVCREFNITEQDWFSLCNTNEERRRGHSL